MCLLGCNYYFPKPIRTITWETHWPGILNFQQYFKPFMVCIITELFLLQGVLPVMNTSPGIIFKNSTQFGKRRNPPMSQSYRKKKVCPYCLEEVSDKSYNLRRHINSKHGDVMFRCTAPGCNFTASRRDNLKTHMRKHLKQ